MCIDIYTKIDRQIDIHINIDIDMDLEGVVERGGVVAQQRPVRERLPPCVGV
jgi:hypothetical protein